MVLGMHKSGTTLVAETLHRSGINMGAFPKNSGYDDGNQHERVTTRRINKSILGCGETDSEKVIRPFVGNLAPARRERMSRLVGDLSRRHADWGFKDPRTCLTYAAWEKVLPAHRLIIVYRPLAEVWSHYRRTCPLVDRLSGPLHSWRVVRAWHVYNQAILDIAARTSMDWIAIDYSRFMRDGDETWRRLEAFTGRRLVDARSSRLYRSRTRPAVLLRLALFLVGLSGWNAGRLWRGLESIGTQPSNRPAS